ncbi:LacI family transcriptional regulator [Microbacterium terrae]|uniref:Ribose operon repressor n=1 Tax=Microbacterium terrae TaxID=69369 RepID=A0A0M2HKR4_9MICO|nr:LacI family DNA-binding transcriptional regulator [Microbacterium terrae]KJL45475.1 Ribose operon repressor [Microbacterium terrae]MBP1079408.1 LacI family transcriptional regulator [Microbacterium terrae]GLJ98808.1 LacI family transcriptional regulator [Microbacterium terrae]
MKRAGIRDVAERAGVSISTVSNALNRPHLVSERLVERVRAAADQLGYVPLQAAQQLRAGRSGLLGMTVINIANPFFGDMVAGAEDAASAAGMRVLLGNSSDDVAKERDHLELFERVQVEGALVSPFGDTGPWLERLRRRGIPVVLVDAVDDTGSLPSVSFDDVAGGRLAADHLLATGRRRLAYVGARSAVRQVRERREGAQSAVDAVPGASLEPIWTERTTSELGRAFGEQIAARHPDDRPDGLVVSNDHLAIGLVYGLISRGVRVPEDVAVVGYDDIEFAAIAAVPLTSVRQPAREMGRTAAEMLLARISGEAGSAQGNIVYQPELAVRASTAGRGAH